MQRKYKGQLFGNNKIVPCIFCGGKLTFKEATVDHIIPLNKGGANVPTNLAISCVMCNNDRGSLPFDMWGKVAQYNKIVRLLTRNGRIVDNALF